MRILVSGLAFMVALLALLVGTLLLQPRMGEAQTEPTDPEFKALLFTKTAGYRHDSIPSGIAMFQKMAADNNFEMVHTEDSAIFNDQDLAQFDVLVMFQTSGDVWNAEQKAALERYEQGGGGIVAIHNAADMRNGYQWWDDLIGTTMTQHSAQNLAGTIKVADKVHPSTAGLPDRWQWREEWYNFDENPRGDVHVLATADETTYDAGPYKMGADHPISWCHDYDGGRAWITALGHHDAAYSEPLFEKHLLGGLRYAADVARADCGGTQWKNFEKVTLDDATKAPMELDVAPDGRVFYIERLGELMVYKPDTRQTVLSGEVPVYTGGEDGLIGMALDPDFGQNNWIYLYYSPPGTEAINRLSRFTVVGDDLDLSSEKKLLDVPAGRTNEPGHTGGGVEFGPNGDLYLSVGDDVNPFQSDGYAPIDERAGRQDFDAQKSSANTNDLRGKILRIHPEADGSYTIPEGNMFPEAQDTNGKTRPEIYAMGFRNPFRFKVDGQTGAIVMGDYGPDNGQANPNRGPDGKVEWNRITKPGFYGWPYCTANNLAYNDYNFATGTPGAKFDCENPVNDSPNNTGLTNLPAVVPADIWYGYGAQPEWPEMGTGGAAPMGGPVYRYDPDLASDTKWPEYYDGAAIFGEWARNYLREIRTDGEGKVLKVNPLLSDTTFKSPMDMEFGPDGSLYTLEWGGGYGISNPESGLYRIDYVKGSRSPIAVAKVDKTSGPTPLTVQFSSAGSRDGDEGDTISYSWDFDGDGAADSTEANPTHTYQQAGDYRVQLTVTDSTGRTGTANISITAGNTAPTVDIEIPENGAFIDFGDQIRYRVEVTDPEDGSNIDCSKVTVTPSLGHDSHAHPLDPATGCEGILQTEEDGHSIDAKIFFILNASYTDNGGQGAGRLTGSDQQLLQPKHKQGEHFDAAASGVQAENLSQAVGGRAVGGITNGGWFSFKPTNLKNINSMTFRVSSTTATSKIEVRQDSPTGPLVATANLKNTGGYNTFTDLDPAPVTDAAGGTHELFFVAVGSLFTVDEVDFNGKGISENGRPVVEAKAAPEFGSAPLKVDFTSTATDPEAADLTYAWDFGVVGTQDDEANTRDASYTYQQAGTYEATLTVTDAGGAKTVKRVPVRVFPALEGEVYVSDIEWISATNGWGPTERDRSNGEQGAADGGPITINETTYQKGVGAHATSEIAINLDGKCQTFTSLVGVDDEVDGGTVAFRVLADDRVVAQTGTLNAQSPATELTADVTGTRVLKLVVTDGGNGNGEDHADWAEARLQCGPGDADAPRVTSATATPSQGSAPLEVAFAAEGTDPNGDALTYEWDFGVPGTDADKAAGKNASHTYKDAGDYTATVTASDPGGKTARKTVAVKVTAPVPPDESCLGARSDNFEGAELDTNRWTVVRGAAGAGPSLSNGGLVMPVTNGDINEGSTGPISFVGQPAPGGEWRATTKVTIAHDNEWQHAGLMLHTNDDNYTKFALTHNQNGTRFFEFQTETNGARTWHVGGLNVPADFPSTLWMRLTSDGTTLSAAYSTDGSTWTTLDGTAPLKAGGDLGLVAAGDTDAANVNAVFDSFAFSPDTPSGPVNPDDEFGGTQLDKCRWNAIVRENPAKYTVGGGSLEIETEPGDINGGSNEDPRNFILQDAPAGDWTLETKMKAPLDHRYQLAGLMIYENDDNYVKYDVVADNAFGSAPDLRAELRKEEGGPLSGGPDIKAPASPDKTYWLRLTKEGNSYSARISADGQTWVDAPGTVTADLENPKMGLMAIGPMQQEPATVGFDYFRFTNKEDPPPNAAPEANDDTATTNEDEPVDVAVLDNDSDPDGDALSVEETADPANGTASASGDGTVRYAPDPGFTGEDSFSYTVSDGNGGTDTARVTMTVEQGTEPDATAPIIRELTPRDGSKTPDRTPRINATVRDRADDLGKDDIGLWVDGRRVEGFSYDRQEDRLRYVPERKMDYGRHTVRVVATDEAGNRSAESWSFRVVRP